MPRFAANLSMMFTEHAFLDRFAAAAAAGFEGVEYLFPYDFEVTEIKAALDAAGLKQALFNCPPGDWAAGERGMAAIPGRGAEFRDAFEMALAYAEIIQPDRMHIMAGNAGGSGAQAAYIENLGWAMERAPDREFVIEPINSRDMPSYFLSGSQQAVGVIDAVGAPNLKLQYDFYHMQIMEGDLTRTVERLIEYIGHTQIAGVPERHEPDAGEFDPGHLFALLDRVGYGGWVGCEYHPAGRTEDGLGWFHKAMGRA